MVTETNSIQVEAGKLIVPDNPSIPFIDGDGIGAEISPVMRGVVDYSVDKAYNGTKKISWLKVLAGEESIAEFGIPLPQQTIDALKKYVVSIKGPLGTPTGEGFRSINVTLRQELDLYACVRPVKHFDGVLSPMKNPEKLDVIIFRENTEDIYSGIEWKAGSEQADKIRTYLKNEFDVKISPDSGIGIKPISKEKSQRLVESAIEYAIKHNRKSVTLVHKGNIMKYTEGAFRNWSYEIAKQKFGDKTITEEELWRGANSDGKIVIKDRIADNMFQQLILRPQNYDILATTNLNGDYLSDASAAQVGGLGIAPGANINYKTGHALFEATHGTAPDIAGKNKANPTSLILSAVMMLKYIGWQNAADLITKSLEKTIKQKTVTGDLASIDSKIVGCTEFGDLLIKNMEA